MDALVLEKKVLRYAKGDNAARVVHAVVFWRQSWTLLSLLRINSRSLKRQLKRSINGPASGPPVALSLSFGPW